MKVFIICLMFSVCNAQSTITSTTFTVGGFENGGCPRISNQKYFFNFSVSQFNAGSGWAGLYGDSNLQSKHVIEYAYRECRLNWHLDFNNANISFIDAFAFTYNTNFDVDGPLPDSITYIGKGAFSFCTSLTNITFDINSKLTYIGSNAFFRCDSLHTLKLKANDAVFNTIVNAFYNSPIEQVIKTNDTLTSQNTFLLICYPVWVTLSEFYRKCSDITTTTTITSTSTTDTTITSSTISSTTETTTVTLSAMNALQTPEFMQGTPVNDALVPVYKNAFDTAFSQYDVYDAVNNTQGNCMCNQAPPFFYIDSMIMESKQVYYTANMQYLDFEPSRNNFISKMRKPVLDGTPNPFFLNWAIKGPGVVMQYNSDGTYNSTMFRAPVLSPNPTFDLDKQFFKYNIQNSSFGNILMSNNCDIHGNNCEQQISLTASATKLLCSQLNVHVSAINITNYDASLWPQPNMCPPDTPESVKPNGMYHCVQPYDSNIKCLANFGETTFSGTQLPGNFNGTELITQEFICPAYKQTCEGVSVNSDDITNVTVTYGVCSGYCTSDSQCPGNAICQQIQYLDKNHTPITWFGFCTDDLGFQSYNIEYNINEIYVTLYSDNVCSANAKTYTMQENMTYINSLGKFGTSESNYIKFDLTDTLKPISKDICDNIGYGTPGLQCTFSLNTACENTEYVMNDFNFDFVKMYNQYKTTLDIEPNDPSMSINNQLIPHVTRMDVYELVQYWNFLHPTNFLNFNYFILERDWTSDVWNNNTAAAPCPQSIMLGYFPSYRYYYSVNALRINNLFYNNKPFYNALPLDTTAAVLYKGLRQSGYQKSNIYIDILPNVHLPNETYSAWIQNIYTDIFNCDRYGVGIPCGGLPGYDGNTVDQNWEGCVASPIQGRCESVAGCYTCNDQAQVMSAPPTPSPTFQFQAANRSFVKTSDDTIQIRMGITIAASVVGIMLLSAFVVSLYK